MGRGAAAQCRGCGGEAPPHDPHGANLTGTEPARSVRQRIRASRNARRPLVPVRRAANLHYAVGGRPARSPPEEAPPTGNGVRDVFPFEMSLTPLGRRYAATNRAMRRLRRLDSVASDHGRTAYKGYRVAEKRSLGGASTVSTGSRRGSGSDTGRKEGQKMGSETSSGPKMSLTPFPWSSGDGFPAARSAARAGRTFVAPCNPMDPLQCGRHGIRARTSLIAPTACSRAPASGRQPSPHGPFRHDADTEHRAVLGGMRKRKRPAVAGRSCSTWNRNVRVAAASPRDATSRSLTPAPMPTNWRRAAAGSPPRRAGRPAHP